MSVRKISAPAFGSVAFPQADDLSKVLDVLAMASFRPKVDESVVAETFKMSSRQGHYYTSAAMFLGLVYKSGGWIRPTPEGRKVNDIPVGPDRERAAYSIVLALPVFSQVAARYAEDDAMPSEDEIALMVRTADPRTNDTTALRRANSVHQWISEIVEEAPDLLPSPAAPVAAFG